MADVLKQTLFWAANPTHTLTDVNGTGPVINRNITAAESHDASDATYARMSDSDDGGGPVNCFSTLDVEGAVQTANVSGAISFVRVKHRGKALLIGTDPSGLGSWQPRINGVLRGGGAGMGSSFADDHQDFATDPADSAAWTNAKINAQSFGVEIYDVSSDSAFGTTIDLYASEFSIELWGPDVQVSTPASVALTLTPNAGLVMPGPVSSSPASVPLTLTPNDGTPVAGLRVVSPESLATPITVPDASFGKSALRDPTAVVPQGTTLDQLATLVTVRSFKDSLADQTLATYERFTSPGTWPNGGTRLEPLYGAGSQGVRGSAGAGNGLQGTGIITGIKLFALVRPMKSAAGSTLTSMRFGTAMGPKSLVATPTVYDYALTPTDAMFALVQTNLITTGPFGNPFTWGNGTDSVWAALFGWTFNHTYSSASTGQFTQLDVAEAWIEIHGALGTEPERIELTHVIDAVGKTVPMAQAI